MLTYPSEKGVSPYTCRVNIPNDLPPEDGDFEFCSQGRGRLVPTYTSDYVEVGTGAVLADAPILRVEETDPDGCVTLYENIDGEFTKVKTSCNYPEDIDAIEYVVESGFFCGYAVQQDSNNNISAAQVTPCVEVLPDAPKAPATPQPVDFDLDATRVEFSWRLPIEPVAVTLVRLDHRLGDGSLEREIISVPSPGSGSGDVVRHGLDVPALIGARDEWCISFRAIGPNPVDGQSLESDWSPERCEERRDDGTALPSYLPWPDVAAAPQGPGLRLGVLPPDNVIYVDVAFIPQADVQTLLRNCFFPVPPDLDNLPAFPRILCKNPGKVIADAIMSQALDFIVYRQSRRADGTTGDWIQVSPLIEFAHWDGPVYDSKRGFTRELNDPYLQFRPFTPGDNDLQTVAFVDRYPYILDTEYRYQFIYFSNDHRIESWRATDWITFTVEESAP